MKLIVYRVLETDEDGDPLDYGVIQAADLDEAARFLRKRLLEIFNEDVDSSETWLVRFIPLMASEEAGVIGSADMSTDQRV